MAPVESTRCDPDGLFSAAERKNLPQVNPFYAAEAEPPGGGVVTAIIEQTAAEYPSQLALIEAWGGEQPRSLTYSELNRQSNRLAHYLIKAGVGPETVVGVFAKRSIELVWILWGVIKAGGAYLPLDPDYPADRVEFMLNDSQAGFLIAQREVFGKLGEVTAKTLILEDLSDLLCMESIENPGVLIKPENLVYVIYTSGSTGKPKGALNTHRGLSNHMLWIRNYCRLDRSDRVFLKSPFSFDGFGLEFSTPFAAGSTLVIAEPGRNWEADYLLRCIREFNLTVFQVVPSFMRVMVEDPLFETCSSLRCLIVGGEAVPPDLIQSIRKRTSVPVLNFYGPAETTIDTVTYRYEGDEIPARTLIGQPIANTQAYVLDHKLQLAADGATGELYLAGDNLGRGYLGRPALTAERFLPNPFGAPGSRMYQTGDVCRLLPDGNLEYLGRVDQQIKVRGFRIEPGEIEAALQQHPDVNRAVVLQHEVSPGDKRLTAYIVPSKNTSVDLQALRGHLAERLPEYMLPNFWIEIPEIPLTLNGKLDRAALPAPDLKFEPGSLEQGDGIPAFEQVMIKIWSELLGSRITDLDANFFDLGGHSLLAIRLIYRLNEFFGLQLNPRSIFETPIMGEFLETVRVESPDRDKLEQISRQILGQHNHPD